MERLKIGLKTFEEIVFYLQYFRRRLPWRLLYIRKWCEGGNKRRIVSKVSIWRHLRRYELSFSFRSHFWGQFFYFFMLLAINLASSRHISFIDELFTTFCSSQNVRYQNISRRKSKFKFKSWTISRMTTVIKNFLAYVTNVSIFLI